jgi:hypothetical protein
MKELFFSIRCAWCGYALSIKTKKEVTGSKKCKQKGNPEVACMLMMTAQPSVAVSRRRHCHK